MACIFSGMRGSLEGLSVVIARRKRSRKIVQFFFFKGLFHRQYIQSVQGEITKIVPVTNLNKYLHYGTSGNV